MVDDVANSNVKPFVLVMGMDLKDTSSSGFAFDQAASVVMRVPDSEMHVIYVLPAGVEDARDGEAAGLLRLYVSEKATSTGLTGNIRFGIHIRRGDPAREIAQLASEVSANLVVLGVHKAPIMRSLLLGSTAERVMAAATCPVFIAAPRPKPQPPHVIVIEAPCPDCLEARARTGGRSWWCERHSESHHLRRHHIYSYQAQLPFEEHDSEVSPTGV